MKAKLLKKIRKDIEWKYMGKFVILIFHKSKTSYQFKSTSEAIGHLMRVFDLSYTYWCRRNERDRLNRYREDCKL